MLEVPKFPIVEPKCMLHLYEPFVATSTASGVILRRARHAFKTLDAPVSTTCLASEVLKNPARTPLTARPISFGARVGGVGGDSSSRFRVDEFGCRAFVGQTA